MRLQILAGALVIAVMSTAACAKEKEQSFQKDFDHNVHYSLNKLSDKQFELTVARLGKAKFKQMNAFATRQGKLLCDAYGFSITYLDGIEGFDDRKGMPNYIFPSLKVKITCPE
jgi:hypothetical protein